MECPYCGSSNVIRYSRARGKPYVQRYRCKACGKQFSDLTGTPFVWTRAAAERCADNSVPVLQAWYEPARHSRGDW
ncbi:MAG: hypothetical protein DRJ64_03230 [Thermoprotei archaeon]|nr:MAG: hypothetical protein DRJ64_03230 [Thermoprotei archaeon]